MGLEPKSILDYMESSQFTHKGISGLGILLRRQNIMFPQKKTVAEISKRAKLKRRFEVKEIAKRLAVITSKRVFIIT